MNGLAGGAPRNGAAPAGSLVAHCPQCGRAFGKLGFVQEYWTGERRVFTCWCTACHFVCDIVAVDRVLSFEPEH